MDTNTTQRVNTGITDLRNLGQYFKKVREELGLTIGAVSAISDLNWSSVNLFEKTPSTVSAIERIAKALGLEVRLLISGIDDQWTEVELSDLQRIVSESINVSNISLSKVSRMSGVTTQGIKTSIKSTNPSVVTLQKLLTALDYKIKVEVTSTDNEHAHLSISSESVSRKITEETDFAVKIGREITRLREQKGLTKAELARQSNISAQLITVAENKGRGFKNFYTIAKFLGYELKVSVLIDGELYTEDIQNLPKVLDSIRRQRDISVYRFSKMSGMTYRSVSVFADSTNSPAASIERYTKTLGGDIVFTFEETNSNSPH